MLYPEETVRPNVLSGARAVLIGLVISTLITLPAMAASSKPVGVVVIADHATVDSAKAQIGTDVFPGDALSTDQTGTMRMKVGASQVYLLASSAATLESGADRVQARIARGTLGFSTTNPSQLEIGTPLGLVRGGDGQRIFAQVAVLSPTKMQISAYEGSLLVIAPNGDRKTIAEGETLEGTLAAPEPGGGQNQQGVGGTGINWKHVAFVAGAAAVLGGTALALWLEETESCTIPPCKD